MIISFTRKFLFVHVYRTGGTSVFHAFAKQHDLRVALRHTPMEDWPKYLAAIGINPEIINLSVHTTAVTFRKVLGKEVYDSFFKFAFVRNPWDHALSLYLYNMKRPDMKAHAAVAQYPTFRDYVLGAYTPDRVGSPQRDIVADGEGNIIVDFVGRFETLAQDFAHVCGQIGVTDALLQSCNETAHNPWPTHYDREMFERVRHCRQGDIKAFNYPDDPAHYGIQDRLAPPVFTAAE
jgi:hypothetical protein